MTDVWQWLIVGCGLLGGAAVIAGVVLEDRRAKRARLAEEMGRLLAARREAQRWGVELDEGRWQRGRPGR